MKDMTWKQFVVSIAVESIIAHYTRKIIKRYV